MPDISIRNLRKTDLNDSLNESLRKLQRGIARQEETPFRYDSFTRKIYFGHAGRHNAIKADMGELCLEAPEALGLLKRHSRAPVQAAMVRTFSLGVPLGISVESLDGYCYYISGRKEGADGQPHRYICGQIKDISLTNAIAEKLLERDSQDSAKGLQLVLEDRTTFNSQLLEGVLDNASESFVVLKCVRDNRHRIRDFRYELVNKAAQYVLGLPLHKLKGHTMLELFPSTLEMGIFDIYCEVVESGRENTREFYYKADGFHNWFRQKVAPFQDGLLVTTTDITSLKEAELAARRQEEKLKVAQELANMGSFEYNITRQSLWCSGPLYHIFGFEPESSAHLGLEEVSSLIGAADRKELEESLGLLQQQPGRRSLRFRAITRFGQKIYLEGEARSEARKGETVDHISGYLQDVTEKRKADKLFRQTMDFLLDTQQIATVGSFAWHAATDRMECTPQLCNIIGLQEAELPDMDSFLSQVHPEDRDMLREALEGASLQDPGYDLEYRLLAKGDKVRYVWGRGKAYFTNAGYKKRIIGTVADITALKMVEKELLDNNLQLQRTNEELEQITHAASHELKEPLRMISIYTGLLQSKYRNQLDEEGLEYIAFAQESAGRVSGLMEEMLLFSRIGRETARHSRVDMNELLDEAMQHLRKEYAGKPMQLQKNSELPALYLPYKHCMYVLHALLDNAMKFHNSNTELLLTLNATCSQGQWQISISDNGPGIKPQYHDKIFLLYQKLHRNGEMRGRGAGLAISRKIVEYHGGRIWVESAEGQGSTFHFTLPDGKR